MRVAGASRFVACSTVSSCPAARASTSVCDVIAWPRPSQATRPSAPDKAANATTLLIQRLLTVSFEIKTAQAKAEEAYTPVVAEGSLDDPEAGN
jgi:hypothetical protein